MLTGYQATVIAFGGDAHFECASHVTERHADIWDDEDLPYWETIGALEKASGLDAYSRYSLEEAFSDGLYCDRCGAELVEPWVDEAFENSEAVAERETAEIQDEQARLFGLPGWYR